MFAKGPKYHELKSINCKNNFKILLDSVEDYARQCAKREKEDSFRRGEECEVAYTDYNTKSAVGLRALALHQSLKDPSVVL